MRKLPHKVAFNHKDANLTSPHSTTKLAYLDHDELICRCQKMAEDIKDLRKSNSRLNRRLKQETSKANLLQLPKNVEPTASNLTSLIDLALSKQYLNTDSETKPSY